MNVKDLDLNLLTVLDVLLEEKNISRTGERIHLSQSSFLSRSVIAWSLHSSGNSWLRLSGISS